MRAVVLGAAAGGGFPQWNSNAPACRRARAGDPGARARTQASLALSADGERWVLLNASPDLRTQIEATPELQPRDGLRGSPISAVLLSGADVDAIAGLLTLRERHAFTLGATSRVLRVLEQNPIFEVLARDVVERRAIALDSPIDVCGLRVELFAVAGKVPLYLEPKSGAPEVSLGEDAVGIDVRHGSRRLVFVPSCAQITSSLIARIDGADTLLFDGTFWTDDEMIRAGLGKKSAQRMGHVALSGGEGTIAALSRARVGRRVFIHINNSNPLLLDDSPERAEAARANWEVAFDGMRFDA